MDIQTPEGNMKFLMLLLMAFSLAGTANTSHFIMADQANIYITKDESFNHLEVLTKTGSSNHIALDFHFKKNLIFFTNPESQAIIRYNKTDKTQLICNVSGEPTALAIDWIKDKVYYVVQNKDISTIYETNLDFSGTSIFITLTSTLIKDLVLDPLAGLCFWINVFKEPKIERCSLNGEGRYTILRSGLVWPNALALDLSKRRLCVSEGKNNYDGKNKVFELSYEGHDVKNFYISDSSHLKGLTCVDGTLYICDYSIGIIWHNHPDNPDNFMASTQLNYSVYLIKHFSDRMQPVVTPVSSGCDTGCGVGVAVAISLLSVIFICVLYWKYRQHGCKFYRTVKGKPNQ